MDEARTVEALVLHPNDYRYLRALGTTVFGGDSLAHARVGLPPRQRWAPLIVSKVAPLGQRIEVYNLARFLDEYPEMRTEK